MDDLKFDCPHCNQSLEAPEELFGQSVDCPACKGLIVIPNPRAVLAPLPETSQQPAPQSSIPDVNMRQVIWSVVAPGQMAIASQDPNKILSLGPDCIPTVIDVFLRPQDPSTGIACNQAVLAIVLASFAGKGNRDAANFLCRIANDEVALFDFNGQAAYGIAKEFASRHNHSDVSEKLKYVQIPADFEIIKSSASDTNGNPLEIRHKSIGIELVYVVAGEFMMGAQDGIIDETPVHKVKLTKGYYIGKYEVTQSQWEAVMGDNPSYFKNSGKYAPVENVSWDNCHEFCRKIGGGLRLPTEAEWEFAARGGNKSKRVIYSGGDNLDQCAWYAINSRNSTHPVGEKKANELGLYDMSGNVWEWCFDWYGDYPSGSIIDPTGVSSGSRRVYRGGSWNSSAWLCRSTARFWPSPVEYGHYLGFRLALHP
jgi:formylglycine-generating enzyme required for sulfatase activity